MTEPNDTTRLIAAVLTAGSLAADESTGDINKEVDWAVTLYDAMLARLINLEAEVKA